jgi:microcystin-dependent protein
MSQPYVGEIRIFAGTFAPAGWMFCAGQLLPISEYDTLFNLIGTTYGGDGQSTFALPNLQSRVPVHMGTGSGGIGTYTLAETGGVENVTLTTQQIPQHNHLVNVTTGGQQVSPSAATYPANATSAQTGNINVYVAPPTGSKLNAATIQPAGGSQPHTNIQPFVAINYIISLFGIYPSPT